MKKKSFFKSSVGTLVLALLVTILMMILHVDFWNWGTPQKIYFGWMPQEFLYRIFFVTVIAPLASLAIIKFSWPTKKDTRDEKGGSKK